MDETNRHRPRLEGREEKSEVEKMYSGEIPISEKELFLLLFESFRYSQGNTDLQYRFFNWFGKNFPHIILPKPETQTHQKVLNDLVTITQSLIRSGKHVDSDEYDRTRKITKKVIKETVEKEMRNLQSSISHPPNQHEGYILDDIMKTMIDRDYAYITGKHGKMRQYYSYYIVATEGKQQLASYGFEMLFDALKQYENTCNPLLRQKIQNVRDYHY